MSEVTIRRAVAADLSAVIELVAEADELHRGALPWLFQRIDETSALEFLDAYVTKDDHAMFVAVAPDGSLAGVLYMSLRPPSRAPIVRPAVVAEISALVVATAFRRQGIGTRLTEAALTWSQASGAARTELAVFEFNESAHAFWVSLGFESLWRRLVLRSRAES